MEKLELAQFAEYLKPRPRDFHKGKAGHVLIVGGNVGFSGAICIAAEAALRVGAGLVTVATREEHASLINLACPEIMSHAVNSAKELEVLLVKADMVIVGPGLGKTWWSQELLNAVFHSEKPLVVDADALNLLAEMPQKKEHWILTPHPGEAARLLKSTTQDVQQDRVNAIKKIQNHFGGVCVLKGAGSLVLSDDGVLAICEAGNPGMATAGMGDLLSGVIGGLVAQRMPLDVAAKLGVLVHALAGDHAAADAGERGMIATDLLRYVRELVNL